MPGLADLLRMEVTDDARRGELGVLHGPHGKYTELSTTVTDPRLLGGRATNIPLLVKNQTGLASLMMGAEPTNQQMEIAILRALERLKAGAFLPSYGSIQEAVNKAESRTLEEKMQPYFRQWR